MNEIPSAKSEVDSEWQGEEKQELSASEIAQTPVVPSVVGKCDRLNNPSAIPRHAYINNISKASKSAPLVHHPSSFAADTLKKPFQPAKQYREVDPVGEYAVAIVLAGVALQKIAGILTWFEVIMPLSFGPGIFIPAFVIALIGLGVSAYSAYRVRKFPEKYRKNEWGKASLAILGWQVLMSALFAWLLGGLPIL